MALAIATNNAALRAAASASSVNRDMETSMARLSTGKRINAARDDAAGVAIASRLAAEIRGTDQAIRNALDGQALIDSAEGGHKEIENILQRMREVSVQAANDTNNTQDRSNLQAEMNALTTEIDRIASVTTWAGQKMMDSNGSSFSFQVGTATGDKNQISVNLNAMSASALGLGGSASSSASSSSSTGRTVNNAISGQGTNTIMAIPAQSGASAVEITIGSVTVTGINISTGNAAAASAAITSAINDGNGATGSNAGTAAHGVTATDALDGAGNINLTFANGATAADVKAYVSGSGSSSSGTITTPQKIGSEFQVNTYTTGDQSQNEITSLSGGGFVVTWMSNTQDGSGKGVYGQLYDSAGNKLNNEFSINTEVTSDQAQPSITGLKDGGFVVAWESTGQDGSGDGVYGQRYDASGNAVGTEFQINTHTSNEQRDVHLASLKDGGFVANWISYNQDGNIWGIFGQRFDSSGNTAGSEFRINTNTANNQRGAQISSLPDGGFLALFGSDSSNHAEPDTSSFGAYGQRYDASGNAVGTEFRINTTTAGHQYYANAAGLKDGNYVIAQSSYGQDGSGGHGIYGQIYDASGNVVKSEFLINTHTSNDQHYASVASLDDGGFFVTWQSEGQDGSKKGVYGQRFDSAGTKVGSELQINSTTNNDQERPSVTTLTDGKLVVAWSSDAQDGDNKGVFAQIFDAGISTLSNSSSSGSSSSSSSTGSSSSSTGSSSSSTSSSSGPTLDSPSNAMAAITAIDTAIKTVNVQRSKLGAVSNRLSNTVNNLTNISSNLSAAQGGIEDADFAKETTDLEKNQILQQASTAMLAQANASKQNVLSLLQG